MLSAQLGRHTARDRAVYGRNSLALFDFHRRPLMARQPSGAPAPYALYRKVGALEKPTAYQDLPALCRAIHRARGHRPISLKDVELPLRDGARPLACVSVWLATDDGEPGSNAGDFIGTAWLNGRGREALQDALRQAEAPRLPDYAALEDEAA